MAAQCMLRYHELYLDTSPKEVVSFPETTKNAFIKSMIRQFYKKNFASADSFVSSGLGQWAKIVGNGFADRSRRVVWSSKAQPWVVWHRELKKILEGFYSKNKGEPLKVGQRFDFDYRGRKFRGEVDEVRQGLVLRDNRIRGREDYLDAAFASLAVFGFSIACTKYISYAEECGVGDRRAASAEELYSAVTFEFNNLSPEKGSLSRRSIPFRAFESLEARIESIEERSVLGVKPNWSQCYRCGLILGCEQRNPRLAVVQEDRNIVRIISERYHKAGVRT
jgi:hypothetical protein